jgi:hypothetical protein
VHASQRRPRHGYGSKSTTLKVLYMSKSTAKIREKEDLFETKGY